MGANLHPRAPGAFAIARFAAAFAICFAACGGQIDNTGLQAWLRVPGAQYIAGPLPAPSGGPAVQVAYVSRQDISPGLNDRTLSGSLDLTATGVLIGLAGDTGYWILPAGPVDAETPTALTLSTPIAFSPLLPSGNFNLEVLAVDRSSHAGAAVSIPLHTEDPALPDAGLAFTLSWDTEADLDLHVVDPTGVEIYWDNISADGGVLDFDSNQSCIIDGLRRERVAWQLAAPPGHYVARVDTPSLCGEPDAHWLVTAQLGGNIVESAIGEAVPEDTRGTHALGAGTTALELDVP